MTVNKPILAHHYDPDTEMDGAFDPDGGAPDLSTPSWVERFAKAVVLRGRPKAATTKSSVTLRLDPDVVHSFKAGGPGWQSRMNAALRKAAGLD